MLIQSDGSLTTPVFLLGPTPWSFFLKALYALDLHSARKLLGPSCPDSEGWALSHLLLGLSLPGPGLHPANRLPLSCVDCPGFTLTGVCFLASLLFFPPPATSWLLPPAPEWEEGSRKCAQSWLAPCFPLGGNTAFFAFNPEKYGSQKACF